MTQREDKQRAKTSREELDKYFYNLSALSFGTTVLGGGMAMVTGTDNPQFLLVVIVIGVFATILFGLYWVYLCQIPAFPLSFPHQSSMNYEKLY